MDCAHTDKLNYAMKGAKLLITFSVLLSTTRKDKQPAARHNVSLGHRVTWQVFSVLCSFYRH